MTVNSTLEKIMAVMEENPTLTTDGYGVTEGKRLYAGHDYNRPQSEVDIIFTEKRNQLMSEEHFKAFEESCNYIATVELTNKKYSAFSAQQKHRVEEWSASQGKAVYVPEGIFIAAALFMAKHSALKVRPVKNGIGAEFNIKVLSHY